MHLLIKYTWFSKKKTYTLTPGEHLTGIYNKWLIQLAPFLIAYNITLNIIQYNDVINKTTMNMFHVKVLIFKIKFKMTNQN